MPARHASESASGSRVYPIPAPSREPEYRGSQRAAGRASHEAGDRGARRRRAGPPASASGRSTTVAPRRLSTARGARRRRRRRPTRRREVRPRAVSPPRWRDWSCRGATCARSAATAAPRS